MDGCNEGAAARTGGAAGMSAKSNDQFKTETKSTGEPKGKEEVTDMKFKTTPGQEQKFKVAKLRENSVQLFGVTTSTFDGAFYGNKKTEMTKKEARAILDKWLGKEC